MTVKFRPSLLVPVLVFCLATSSTAQWNWAIHAGGGYRDWSIPNGICTDQAGNIILAGDFINTPQADLDGLGTKDLTSDGVCGLIMKYAPNGKRAWLKYYGNALGYWAQARGVAVDSSGNIYVVGTFVSSMKVDGIDYVASGGAIDGRFELYLMKLSPEGNFLWVKTFGAPFVDDFTYFNEPIHVTPAGNIRILGVHGGTMVFDETSVTKADGDYFIAEFTPAGSLVWIRAYGPRTPRNADRPIMFDVDRQNNMYVTAYADHSAASSSDSAYTKLYLMKLDPIGTPLWRQDTFIHSNVRVSGEHIINYGAFGGEIKPPIIPNGLSDLAIASYTKDGNCEWRKTFGGDNTDYISSISAAQNGDLYFGEISWGPITIGSDHYGAPESWIHSFIIHTDANANILEYRKVTSMRPFQVTSNHTGQIFVTGQLDSTLAVGSTKLEPLRDTSTTGFCNDIFLGQFSFALSAVNDRMTNEQPILFPNPADRFINISLPTNSKTPQTLSIVNVLGVNVATVQLTQPTQRIDLASFPQGFYRAVAAEQTLGSFLIAR